jgi:hypothetical protein
VIGWLLDTNVISAIINPNGAANRKGLGGKAERKQVISQYLSVGRV